MFKNVKFDLTKACANVYRNDPPLENRFSSTLHCEIRPLPSFDQKLNLKTCRIVEIRLADKIPISEWKIAIKLENNNGPTLSISAEGDMLKMIHSLMSYNVGRSRLNLTFCADVHLCLGVPPAEIDVILRYTTALHPNMINGEPDHSKYTNVMNLLTCDTRLAFAIGSRGKMVKVMEVEKVCISIEGIASADLKEMTNVHPKDTPKFIHKQRLSSDSCILCKSANEDSGNMKIRVNGTILCAQSSVIRGMLEAGKFKEGASREIPMTDRTQKEVTSFLDFLYYGSIDNAAGDSSLAVTLYEMGHYYDVNELEKTMKLVLLSRPAESFEVDAAMRLFKFAHCIGDMDLKQMAVDVLKMQTDANFLSGLPLDIFQGDSGAITELFRMHGRF